MPNKNPGRAEQRYKSLATEREQYLERGRRLAALTIPAILPPEGIKGGELPKPYQGMGARGVNNLSSKMLLSLLPLNSPFWRLEIDESLYLDNPDMEAQRTEHEQDAADIERLITEDIEVTPIRPKVFEMLRQLLVIGNSLLHLPANGSPRVFRLDSYCVDRDPSGNLIEVVTKQKVAPQLLSKAIRQMVNLEQKEQFGDGVFDDDSAIEIYTHARLTTNGWEEHQEIAGVPVPGSMIQHGEHLPYIAPRMIVEDGSNYSRSLCEEYEGDLRSLEGLSKAVLRGALASSRLIGLVNPGGRTDIKSLKSAPDGGFVMGRQDDVKFLQVDKFADLQTAYQQMQVLESRLANVFLINVQRQAERVTAEEVRLNAIELETGLGGVFTLLSQELQLPLVGLYLERARSNDEIPDLEGIASPHIVTGLDAIGRGHDAQRLNTFMNQAALHPDALRRIDGGVYAKMLAISLGIETEELIIPEEVIQQQDQQAQAMAMAEKATPEIIKQFPDETRQAMQAQAG